jgi:hypothetical protein
MTRTELGLSVFKTKKVSPERQRAESQKMEECRYVWIVVVWSAHSVESAAEFSQANLGPFRRGQGTIFFPGPGLSGLGDDTAGAPAASDSSNWLLVGLMGLGFYLYVAPLFEGRQRQRDYYKKLTKMTPARYRKERRDLGLE